MTLVDPRLITEILNEIDRGNAKHGHGAMATKMQVIAILTEELGEFAQATMKEQHDQARKELIQVCAVALNFLNGTGPHFSNL